ncbi:MAG: hypothetical protein BWY79_01170 [Actinobacteria bacterium ADurb.Bin444]|nr:MAG: hypothetical protein BWY79_01170 [Actinobacteria bacterium ADurb.Bin444]
MCDDAETVYVGLGLQRYHEDIVAVDTYGADLINHPQQEVALVGSERVVQISFDQCLRSTQTHTYCQHLRIANRTLGVDERPRVLVYAEREDARLEWADRDFSSQKDVNHGRRL